MTNTLLTLHDPEAARHYYAEGLWRADTLYTLLAQHAGRRPDAFALRDSRRRLTWAELLAMVDAVAADLDAAGLKRGERVAVWLPNRVEAVAVFLACSRQGYVCPAPLHSSRSPATAPMPIAPTSSPRPPRSRACAASTRSPMDRRMRRRFRSRRQRGRCRRPTATPTRSPTSLSPRARPARRKASCIP